MDKKKKDSIDNNRGRDIPMTSGLIPMNDGPPPPRDQALRDRFRLRAIMKKLNPYVFAAHENQLMPEEYASVTVGPKSEQEWQEIRSLILEAIDLGQPRKTFPPSMMRRAGLN